MAVSEIFNSVFKVDGKLATVNMVPRKKVYGEQLVREKGTEYRLWDPYRSKLAAAILKGMKSMEIGGGSTVLYLGAATGTTVSHVSDIVGKEGIIYCIEFSERNFRELYMVCESRSNTIPILSDARDYQAYGKEMEAVDILYEDVSARDQAEILLGNAELLKKGGYAYVAIKSQSISTSRDPKEIYKEFLGKLEPVFEILEKIDIMPYDKAHLFVVLKKK